jgi:hypothetical protein
VEKGYHVPAVVDEKGGLQVVDAALAALATA